MQSRIAFVLLCGLSSSVSSARVRPSLHNPEEDNKLADVVQDTSSPCSDAAILDVLTSVMDQITAYYQQCGLNDEQHLTFNGNVPTVTEEGKELLCQKPCQSREEFADDAPDYSEMLEKCDNELMSTIRTHAAFDAARKACESEAPLMDDVDEGTIANVVAESPVAPLKGKKIKQMQFEYELKAALAVRNDPTCKTLKTMFKKCDYKKRNQVFLKQVDDMLDLVEPEKKVESLQLLTDVYANANKNPETDFLTFKDWVHFKFGEKQANECALEYAKNK